MASSLFQPFTLGRLTLRNRVVMAPMTREMAPGGVPDTAMASYYGRRAAGGVGLIISEGASPAPAGSFGASVPWLFGADALDGWRQVVDAVHSHGSAMFAQIWHVGAFSPSLIGMADSLPAEITRLSPSGLAAPARPFGRAMDGADIEAAIESFASAAANARAVGFDGVEIHGAHGYLPDQFLWAGTNVRADRYGGTVAARLRFVTELVRAIRAATAPDFPISLRLSQWKQLDYRARLADTPAELAAIVGPLADAGVDIFHASTRRFWEAEFAGDPRNLAGWIGALSGRPVITVGSVTLGTDFKAPDGKRHAAVDAGHVAMLDAGLAAGHYDLVAIGRALLANPDWCRLVAGGQTDRLRAFDKSMLQTLQ